MFTQQEKDYLLKIVNAVVPTGKSREEVRTGLALLDTIYHKLEQMPVEEPVKPRDDAATAVKRRLRK